MVRVPPGLHQQAARSFRGNVLAYRPSPSSGRQPIIRTPISAYAGRVTGIPLTGGQVQGVIPGSVSGTLVLLQNVADGGYVIQANEFGSVAPFSLAYTLGPPYGFQIATCSINNPFPGSPGAYPSIYCGGSFNYGAAPSAQNPYPIQVSSIVPNQISTSLAATMPGAGVWDCSYDNWFNINPIYTNFATNGLEWMIWLQAAGGNVPAGTLIASGVSIGSYTFNVYFHTSWANASQGTVTFLHATPQTSTTYDIYPFLQYMIGQGWLNAAWWLVSMQAGFEIWSGTIAGAAVNSFSVSNAPNIALSTSGRLSLSVGPQGLGTVWYPAQATISTSTGPLDTSTCIAYLGAQGIPITQVGTVFPGGAGTIALAIPDMTPGQAVIFVWTGAHPGDIAAANVIGTMDALHTVLYSK